jgi:hypothetical protein
MKLLRPKGRPAYNPRTAPRPRSRETGAVENTGSSNPDDKLPIRHVAASPRRTIPAVCFALASKSKLKPAAKRIRNSPALCVRFRGAKSAYARDCCNIYRCCLPFNMENPASARAHAAACRNRRSRHSQACSCRLTEFWNRADVNSDGWPFLVRANCALAFDRLTDLTRCSDIAFNGSVKRPLVRQIVAPT